MFEVFKEFTFEAAHSLPHLPIGHKCRNVHGHSYCVTVHARAKQLTDGMVIDYAELSKSWREIYAMLDHRFINDVGGLEVSTAENLAKWIYTRMKHWHPAIYQVTVKETASAGAIYQQ